jgi:hypothetical protein
MSLGRQWWPISVFVAFAVGGLWLALTGTTPSERGTGWACAGLFGTFTLLFGGFIIGKRFERGRMVSRDVAWNGQARRAYVFPASQLQMWVLWALMLLVGLFGVVAMVTPVGNRYRFHAAAAAIGGLGVAVVLPFGGMGRNAGIALLPEGVLWLKKPKSPVFVAWENLQRVAVAPVPDHEGTLVSSLCLKISGASGPGTADIAQTRFQTGYELTWAEEALTLPAAKAERVLRFYLENPSQRAALGTSEGEAWLAQLVDGTLFAG